MTASTATAAPPPLNGPVEWVAPPSWRSIEFISDLHLSDKTPRTFDAWSRYMQTTEADAVVMLGDLFEVWIGDDTRTLAFEASCVEVMVEAARKRPLYFMAGNRDFLIGADMLRDTGMQELADPTLLIAMGQRILLTHGDSLCLEDVDYQRFRQQVRNPLVQKQFLSQPLAVRQHAARQIRGESQARKDGAVVSMEWADIDVDAAMDWLRACGTTTMLHGHTHRPGSNELAPGFVRHVLSDWDLDHPPLRADVMRLGPDGLARIVPTSVASTAS
jgi:UDP-2,3-diacylglucosamine hydrolase